MKWELKHHYRYPGPDFYETDKVQYGLPDHRLFVKAFSQTRVNGPCTAYGTVRFTVEWSSNQHWGININRHFKGSHAGQNARAWCKYMTENPPSSWQPLDDIPRQMR